MRLIQFENDAGQRQVGRVEGDRVHVLRNTASTRELALAAIDNECGLLQEAQARGSDSSLDYPRLLEQGRLLPPLDHPDPAHCLVSGTGLTHLGSAAARDKMHQQQAQGDAGITDTMRIFKWGLEGGKPLATEVGAQPEWFYKGDGSIVVRPGGDFPVPPFAEDAGEEPELTGLYVIGADGRPYRLGYALGNEFSDHVMERRNYLYLAHSKLRYCAYGPELRVGALPGHLAGTSRVLRDGKVLWEQEFLSGEDNMCHSLANLEYHHFKYAQFLRPGDVHVHYFGTATLSFADGIRPRPGDRFQISLEAFGAPLENGIGEGPRPVAAGQVRGL
ncbi:AraD1 family protein [Pseudomonas sp. CMR5c]|uniref:AraD1 family protein n=1 Tax=Pseudomonas sp. CMR5c TaxID=658630 RepID=UPI00069DC910|nr:AraD1 family protein [Pseudomonas sp. CMR5c]AZC16974.1 Uncharacterized protein GguC [Pseudomonas sp. CMR5c]